MAIPVDKFHPWNLTSAMSFCFILRIINLYAISLRNSHILGPDGCCFWFQEFPFGMKRMEDK